MRTDRLATESVAKKVSICQINLPGKRRILFHLFPTLRAVLAGLRLAFFPSRGLGAGLYSPAISYETYVIVTERRRIGPLARASGADFFVVECWTPCPGNTGYEPFEVCVRQALAAL